MRGQKMTRRKRKAAGSHLGSQPSPLKFKKHYNWKYKLKTFLLTYAD